jgi:hypothetical protein
MDAGSGEGSADSSAAHRENTRTLLKRSATKNWQRVKHRRVAGRDADFTMAEFIKDLLRRASDPDESKTSIYTAFWIEKVFFPGSNSKPLVGIGSPRSYALIPLQAVEDTAAVKRF